MYWDCQSLVTSFMSLICWLVVIEKQQAQVIFSWLTIKLFAINYTRYLISLWTGAWLTWVLDIPLSCSAAQLFLAHAPYENYNGNAKMDHPVVDLSINLSIQGNTLDCSLGLVDISTKFEF